MEEFVVVQSTTLECNYVMLRSAFGDLHHEVCCREWDCRQCGNPSISRRGYEVLYRLGFEGGGRYVNPSRCEPPPYSRFLAAVTDEIFARVYEDPDADVVVYFREPALTRRLLDWVRKRAITATHSDSA